MAVKDICSIEECDNQIHCRNLCNKHYRQWKKKADPAYLQRKRGNKLEFIMNVALLHTGTECLISPFREANGYSKIGVDGESIWIHRYVCQLAHGEPPTPKHTARHSCGNGAGGCISPHHLSWATRSENEGDKVGHGTSNRGERNGQAKLTEADVRRIRMLAKRLPQKSIAQLYDVGHQTISQIVRKKSWRWL